MNDVGENSQDRFMRQLIEAAHRPLSAWAFKNPQHAKKLAYGILGSAVAIADGFGVPVEQFVAQIRQQTGGVRERLIPPGTMVDALETFASTVSALAGVDGPVKVVRLRQVAYDKITEEIAKYCNVSAVVAVMGAKLTSVEAYGVRIERDPGDAS